MAQSGSTCLLLSSRFCFSSMDRVSSLWSPSLLTVLTPGPILHRWDLLSSCTYSDLTSIPSVRLLTLTPLSVISWFSLTGLKVRHLSYLFFGFPGKWTSGWPKSLQVQHEEKDPRFLPHSTIQHRASSHTKKRELLIVLFFCLWKMRGSS